MKNFRILFGILGLVLAFSLAQAQGDAKANKLISQSQAKFDGLKDITANFTYTLRNPNLKKPIVKEGKATLKKNKYKIVFPDEEMYCNGKYIWVKMNQDEEIIKSDFDPENSVSPDRVYTLYEEDMKTKYDGEENGAHKITLFANQDQGEIWKTTIWINKSSKLIDKAIMFARNGSEYQYDMKNIQSNTGITDATFMLDEQKYEDQDWIITDQSEM